MKERASARVEKVSNPGKYSRKTKQREKLEESSESKGKTKPKCWNRGKDKCNFKFCPAKKSTCRSCG